MTRADLVSLITTKTQQTSPGDIAACQLFLSKRYELIWNSYLWKDSLLMASVPFDPVNNLDNANGILVLPESIERVVAVRTLNNSVQIAALEYFYRIDYNAFVNNNNNLYGSATQFSILSPLWFVWHGYSGLTLTAASDIGTQFKVSWRDENEAQYVQLLQDGDTLLSALPLGANIVPAGAVYSFTGAGIYQLAVMAGAYYYLTAGTEVLSATSGTTPDLMASGYFKAGTSLIAIISAPSPAGTPVTVKVQPVQKSQLEIESVFKPANTNGTVSLNPTIPGDLAGGTLSAAQTASPKFQRIRLFSIPNTALTINVLGKRPVIQLDYDTEVPLIRNLDNCLIAIVCGDMWERSRQVAKAQTLYQEGAALLKELALLETVQAANYQKIIPADGYGDPYFNPDYGPGLSGYGL